MHHRFHLRSCQVQALPNIITNPSHHPSIEQQRMTRSHRMKTIATSNTTRVKRSEHRYQNHVFRFINIARISCVCVCVGIDNLVWFEFIHPFLMRSYLPHIRAVNVVTGIAWPGIRMRCHFACCVCKRKMWRPYMKMV